MRNDPFEYAIDAIDRMDYVGYSGWNQRKLEAKQRLAFARNLHVMHLSQAKTRGVILAALWIVGIEVSLFAALWYYRLGS